MKYVVSFSGGLGSFMSAEICRKEGKDFELVFCDTMSEDIDLYRFNKDVENYFQKPIKTLCYGSNIWQAQIDVGFQASSRRDPCSRVTKREMFRRYMLDTYTAKEATLVIGIGSGEKHRTAEFESNHAPYKVYAPLVDMPEYSNNEELADYCEEVGIKPARLYGKKFKHNNCKGFCVKSGQKQAAMLLKHFPENYAWHENEQERMFAIMGFARGTIRKQVDGVMYYLTLKQFREFIEGGGIAEQWEEGNCACF